MEPQQGFATSALHTNISKADLDGSTSLAPPLMTAATYRIPSDYELNDQNRMFYGRYGSATRNGLEKTMGKLEGVDKPSITFASGMAAINAVVEALLQQGDHIVSSKQMYGGTFSFFNTLSQFGISCSMVTQNDVESVVKLLTPKTKLVWMEVCTNPIMEIMDVRKMAAAIHGYNKDIIFGVDNTYLSPYILQPLSLGVDLVMHSCTKFLGGHSDVVMGSITSDRDDICQPIRKIQIFRGAIPSSFDCYLMHRSLFTLEVRMQRHHDSSLKIARYLIKHPAIEKVIHPLLPDHPSHELAKQQHRSMHSGMLSIYVKGGETAALTFLKELKIISCAVSLGGVHSLASYPAKLSHSFLSKEEREELQIGEGLIRISIGLETPEDLMRDMDQALVKATGLGPLAI